MRFDKGIAKKYRQSIDDAFATILAKGNDFHKYLAQTILDSKMLVCVFPVSRVNASGITGLINPKETWARIKSERLGLSEALGEVFITIAEETIDTGGQRGCEGTFVHEGRHAYDYAQAIASFSDTAVNPLGIFDPTVYELELEAHRVAGEYMLQMNLEDYLSEGLQLMILGQNEKGFFLSDEGIHRRLQESYGLDKTGNQGQNVSQMFGFKI